jgi:CHAT domain-containing protein
MDDALFDLPVPALVCGRQHGHPVYLIERRDVELTPGAWALGADQTPARASGFLGVADGVYNAADPRYGQPPSNPLRVSLLPRLTAASAPPLELPRLIASAREVEACATRSQEPAKILTGAQLNRREMIAALAAGPRLVHIAAHFLSDIGSDRSTAIALGLRPGGNGSGRLDLLTAEDVASLRLPASIIVLSGCSSGAGRIVPAAGLVGLARAWLSAGATAVIASQWPTPDDTGELFAKFYDHLRTTAGGDRLAPAEALARAQVDMLRSGTWRADPHYWAAYQIMGRSN